MISIFYLPFQILLSKILLRYPPPICRYEDVKSAGSHQDETRAVASVTGGSHKLVRSQVRQAILEYVASPSGPENGHTVTRMNPPPLHTRPLIQSGKIFSGEASCAETGSQLQGRGRARKSTTEKREVSNYVRFCLNPYLLPRRGLASAYGCPEAFDAPLPIIIQPLPPIPIPNKGRNAELFHFCKRLNLHGPVETDVPQFIMYLHHISALSMDLTSQSLSEMATALGWRTLLSWHTRRFFLLLVIKLRPDSSMSQHMWKQ